MTWAQRAKAGVDAKHFQTALAAKGGAIGCSLVSLPGMRIIDKLRKRGFWRAVQWIFLWGTVFGLSGVMLVAVTNKAVIWSSSDAFCGQFCHSMTWASVSYQQGPHFINTSGVRASCGRVDVFSCGFVVVTLEAF
jgi:hypothetical protein